jgi:hypothetical protein
MSFTLRLIIRIVSVLWYRKLAKKEGERAGKFA